MRLSNMQFTLLIFHLNGIFGQSASLVWSCTQYTGLLDDYIMFGLCCIAGVFLKYLKFSRVSFFIGFILSERIEKSWVQFNTYGYGWEDMLIPKQQHLLLWRLLRLYGDYFLTKQKLTLFNFHKKLNDKTNRRR